MNGNFWNNSEVVLFLATLDENSYSGGENGYDHPLHGVKIMMEDNPGIPH
jgi:hypothetical protein